jgi:uncharacterized repeat protein (TIGR03806 family)
MALWWSTLMFQWWSEMKKYFCLIGTLLLLACSKEKSPESIDYAKLPYPYLADYGLFTGKLSELKEAKNVIPYEPVSSLFTDYAFKKRYVWMPESTAATLPVDPDESIHFPDKTILIKHFYYPLDFRKPEGDKQVIETRLLIKTDNKWDAYAYLWNEQQTEAKLKNTGGSIPVNYTNENGQKVSFTYAMPQKTQCRSCHSKNEALLPIGPKGKQLNYPAENNQLEKWISLGILKTDKDLKSIVALIDPTDHSQTLNNRARAYLDVNCGHCHSKSGPASTSGLYYNAEESNPFHLGVLKSPVAAGMGGGGFKFDINPGYGMQSIVTHRMNSTHPGVMMPEIGRVTIHKEGVELISKWIDEMK